MGRHCRSFPFDHKNRGLADQPTPGSDCGGSEAYDLSIASAPVGSHAARTRVCERPATDRALTTAEFDAYFWEEMPAAS